MNPNNTFYRLWHWGFCCTALYFYFIVFDPSATPPPLLDIPFCSEAIFSQNSAHQRGVCICCKATTSVLKNPKIRMRKDGWRTFVTVLGGVGPAAMWVCIPVLCIGVYSDQYILFLPLFSILDPPSVMYTYHDDNDVFKKSLSLLSLSLSLYISKISKHKSLYRNDNDTKRKRTKKKKVNVLIKG